MENKIDIPIPFPSYHTERGNILLMNEFTGGVNAWIRLKKNYWAEVSVRKENYPIFTLNFITIQEWELARHINTEFESDDWFVSKMNIEGVIVDEENHIDLSRSFDELIDWQVEIVKRAYLTDSNTPIDQKKQPKDDDLYKFLKKNIDRFNLLFQKPKQNSEEEKYGEIWIHTFKGDAIAFKEWCERDEPNTDCIIYATEGEDFQEYTYAWGEKVKNDMPVGTEINGDLKLFSHIRYG